MTEDRVPEAVLRAYRLDATSTRRVFSLINRTFFVDTERGRFVVQRLHSIFDPEVNLDIEAITGRLAAVGVATPRLLRTRDGDLWLRLEGETWRVLSYLEGVTYDRIVDRAQARAAGVALAAFHLALADFDYDFRHTRSGVHDTGTHLAQLAQVSAEAPESFVEAAAARALAAQVLEAARAIDLAWLSRLPLHICHGDPKISNLLFAREAPPSVVCMIDLDTLGRQSLAYELGDALRSWCNPNPEDRAAPELDEALFASALEGYAARAGDTLTRDELVAIVPGLEAVCLELSARFCRDIFEDSYFGWDGERYESRRAHNLARARSQLALARDVAARKPRLERLARDAFMRRSG